MSSTSLTSLYFGVHADEEDKTEFMFDSASVEYIKKETVIPQDSSFLEKLKVEAQLNTNIFFLTLPIFASKLQWLGCANSCVQ